MRLKYSSVLWPLSCFLRQISHAQTAIAQMPNGLLPARNARRAAKSRAKDASALPKAGA
jgi:hypothetical protein